MHFFCGCGLLVFVFGVRIVPALFWLWSCDGACHFCVGWLLGSKCAGAGLLCRGECKGNGNFADFALFCPLFAAVCLLSET
jgi:hypothetical protein